MPNEHGDRPLCPGAAIGMPMNISLEGLGMFKCSLIGMEYDQYLIVKLPPLPDIPAKLYQKNHIVVRYFHGGNAYGFRSTLIGMIKDPVRLHFLAYPDSLEHLNLRKDERYVCFIPARISKHDTGGEIMDLQGFISDISAGGCSFECKEHFDSARKELAVGTAIDFFFRFHNEETWRVIPGEIRTFRGDQNKLVLGIKYRPDLSRFSPDDTLGAIQAFIEYFQS